ncbi:MAG: GlsB/YeaQ/YmgE family stress response membrane protein [Actinomycetota bacterium]
MVGILVAGLIIGALARAFKPGRQRLGLLATMGIGLLGSVVGGLIASLLGTGSLNELNVIGFIISVVAAVVFLGVAEGMAGKRA